MLKYNNLHDRLTKILIVIFLVLGLIISCNYTRKKIKQERAQLLGTFFIFSSKFLFLGRAC